MKNQKNRPRTSASLARRAKSAASLVAGLLLGQTLLAHGQGFGFLPLDSVPPSFALSPMGGSRVLVTRIDSEGVGSSVLVDEYRNGFQPDCQAREIFNSPLKLWSVKHEINADDHHFLAVIESIGSTYSTRLFRFDPEYRELAQSKIPAKSFYLPPGRMLSPESRLFIGTSGVSASGRFVEGETLSPDFSITIQNSTTVQTDPNSTYSDSKTIYATGLDTAIENDGTVTALYHYNWLRVKRYDARRRLKESLLLDRPPFSYFTRTGMTAVAVNESKTNLLAWEWHEHTVIGTELKRFPSIPAFRAIRPDGTMTDTIKLQPASSYADRHDRPAVGLRPDGSGAVAWTVRTGVASAVWLQRLDANQGAYEPPRLVDARPDFYTDQPVIESDKAGNLFLAWRCTATEGDSAQIGILDLSQIDQAPAPPQITCVEGKIRVDWVSRPATRTSLWHSCDLNPDHAEQIHSDESMPGPCHHEHAPTSSSGFYWVRSE